MQRKPYIYKSGPIEAVVLKRDDAILQWRSLMGPTHIGR